MTIRNEDSWDCRTSEDFRRPEAQGRRPTKGSLLNSYSRRIQELSACNRQVLLRFFEVQHALKPLTVLFSPTLIAKVLFSRP